MRRFVAYGALLVAAFMLGCVPLWLQSRASSSKLSGATRLLGLATIENTLASATIDAERGNYELARLATSSFHTFLREETNRVYDSLFSLEQREGVLSLLAGGDDIITLLARSDPASAERLSDLYVSYRGIMNR